MDNTSSGFWFENADKECNEYFLETFCYLCS